MKKDNRDSQKRSTEAKEQTTPLRKKYETPALVELGELLRAHGGNCMGGSNPGEGGQCFSGGIAGKRCAQGSAPGR